MFDFSCWNNDKDNRSLKVFGTTMAPPSFVTKRNLNKKFYLHMNLALKINEIKKNITNFLATHTSDLRTSLFDQHSS